MEALTMENAEADHGKIADLLAEHITSSALPASFFPYMAGMIVEDPPVSGAELCELIGEFIQNGKKVSKERTLAICNEISGKLIERKLIRLENKFSFAAERLVNPVTLNDLKLAREKDVNSGYDDAFLGSGKFVFQDKLDFEKKTKKKEKDEKKQREAYEKHIVEMESIRRKLPPTEVKHNKEGSKLTSIIVDNLSLIVGGKPLLEAATLQLVNGRKYGLVGRNGIGKTSLLAALARGDFPKVPRNLQILLVEQEIVGDERSVIDTVLQTDTERHSLLEEEKILNGKEDDDSANRLLDIYKRLEEIDAFTAESRAAVILSGLGFQPEMQKRATKDLSGGWRMRVALARALFVQPDILLLDEPTNHLDLDAVMWLEDYVVNCKNIVVVVSHAREFLNVVCTDVIHFFDSKLTYYKGNYDAFEKERHNKLTQQAKQLEAQQRSISHMQSFIDKFRYNAKRASLVQSRIKALNKMELVEDIIDDPTCVFIFPTPDKLRPPLLKIEDGLFGYSVNSIILKNLNFGVDMESRIAIVGSNGVGKTTFLKLLINEINLIEGQQYRHNRLRISMFSQHHVDGLNLTLSPLEQMAQLYPGSSSESYRSHLGSFGISGNLSLRPMYLLSGGQKSRVAFAVCVWKNPHILIMDEPTNHLDIDAVNALIIALNNFQGGVLIVSHDQHLIASVCDHIWYIKDQKLKKFNGDFEDYRRGLASGRL